MTHISAALARIENARVSIRAASPDSLPDWHLELLAKAEAALLAAKSELAMELAERMK